ncbi:MAG TPA: hypothetical protein VK845_14710 [Gemmatimonadales bacterium]|nr:hypothetical protein [Gemmatimonadales bacterium]
MTNAVWVCPTDRHQRTGIGVLGVRRNRGRHRKPRAPGDVRGFPVFRTGKGSGLPAVGKSLTLRTIGITRYGRRTLEFDHDRTRAHSPIIDQTGKIIVDRVEVD